MVPTSRPGTATASWSAPWNMTLVAKAAKAARVVAAAAGAEAEVASVRRRWSPLWAAGLPLAWKQEGGGGGRGGKGGGKGGGGGNSRQPQSTVDGGGSAGAAAAAAAAVAAAAPPLSTANGLRLAVVWRARENTFARIEVSRAGQWFFSGVVQLFLFRAGFEKHPLYPSTFTNKPSSQC